ncbi:hypothetical protein CAPTEDRAFT_21078 [Capitella teleta]|uniref:Aquaporin n=1 Tax=Capitella teleta TaxID=283909 RepID=R7U6B7_CAPTE|nr:hypothetical protein CAPTEDRAFT_21078 [Capitella teleta]|eukprot:ELU01895.1 hypothetical protein CAPTEDRAFT_21078 [Capitella teleta]
MSCFTKMPNSIADLKNVVFWRDVLVEVLGTGILLTWITFSFVTFNPDHYQPNTTTLGLFVGFLVFILIETLGPYSGCHMNPAVTLGFFLNGHLSIARSIFYVIAQCSGGAGGSALVYALTPASKRHMFHAITPSADVSLAQAIGHECIFTFLLVFTALFLTLPSRKSVNPGFPLGFCVGTSIMCGGTYSGSTLNPVVALGPAVISRNFHDHWVYWVGPLCGGVVAFLLFKAITVVGDKFEKPNNNNNKEKLALKREELGALLEEFLEEKITSRKIYLDKLSAI